MKSRLQFAALILSLLFSSVVLSQKEVIILDENGNTLPGAHVTYKALDSKKGKTTLSDISGKALVPIEFIRENETFILHIGYVGYMDRTDTVQASSTLEFKMSVDKVSLNQVVITGQYSPNSPEKSIHKIKIIDREQMDSRGVVNLNDALQFETNMRISQDNMLGSAASVQGISGENVKIMIDGVPVVGRQDGNIDLNQINLNNIERIEIVEGPLSVNYGTNALAGTINLISKKDQKNRFTTGLNSYYESVGQYNVDASLGYKKGKHRLGFNLGRNYFDGWSSGEEFTLLPKTRPADTNRNLQWNPKEQIFANGQYTLSIDDNSYRVFADYFDQYIINRGSPREPYRVSAFDEHYITKRIMGGVDLSGKVYENYNWNILASYSDYKRLRYTYIKNLTNLNEKLTLDSSHHDTTNIHTWMSRGAVRYIKPGKRVHGEIGYDFNNETATGKRIEDQEQSIGDYAIFTTAEWYVTEHTTIKPGLRFAHNTAYQAPLIPSINFKYDRNIFSIRFSFARGFRAPSIKELYFEFNDSNHKIYGNPDLEAESSSNFQLDASFKIVKDKYVSTFSAGAFYNDIKDMISLAQLEDGVNYYSYINIGSFKTQGIDLQINQTYSLWRVSLGFVYTGRSNSVEDSSVISTEMFYSPEFRAVLSREFKQLGGNLSFFYKYNGKVPIYSVDETGGMSERFSEAYEMIDVTATKYFWNKRIHWSFGIKNLLDVQNVSTAGTAGSIHNNTTGSVPISWGRTFFTSLKFNLSWN